MKMRACLLFLLLSTQLILATSLGHLILSKGLTIPKQLQGVKPADASSGNALEMKLKAKLGKGSYGGANMNRDPRASKNNTPSQFPRSIYIVGFGFSMFLLLGV